MEQRSDNKLICIVGPTAIGKTSLSIEIARRLQAEVISADSRQFYKEMCIGTAVPTAQELSIVPHHFIQHKSIHQAYNVTDFEQDAIEKITSLFQTHRYIVLVGGSGLYIDAITKGLDNIPTISPAVRAQLNQDLEHRGLDYLQTLLQQKDPLSYAQIDIQNPRRVIRALEIILDTGQPYVSFLNKPKTPRNFETIKLGLTTDRPIIYQRIEQRVDLMIAEGLEEEAKKLYAYKHLNALQTVGYRELFDYFDEKITLSQAIDEIKKNTRRFAKRQLTWFGKDPKIEWIDISNNMEEAINQFLQTLACD